MEQVPRSDSALTSSFVSPGFGVAVSMLTTHWPPGWALLSARCGAAVDDIEMRVLSQERVSVPCRRRASQLALQAADVSVPLRS